MVLFSGKNCLPIRTSIASPTTPHPGHPSHIRCRVRIFVLGSGDETDPGGWRKELRRTGQGVLTHTHRKRWRNNQTCEFNVRRSNTPFQTARAGTGWPGLTGRQGLSLRQLEL